jgi:2-oxoglutarate dehydrogenase E2 component (dihydrolipoamide succinyltransferase)
MAVEVKIPAVGESISSGIVSVWHKKSGDFVNAGDALFTLETDKVSTEIAAETSGVLDTIVPEGQEVKIGEVVATIDDSKKASTEPKPEKKKEAEPSPQSSPKGRGRRNSQQMMRPAFAQKLRRGNVQEISSPWSDGSRRWRESFRTGTCRSCARRNGSITTCVQTGN